MNDIIFISSMTHSGSTLLNIILGGHNRLIGLGEIFQLIRDRSKGLQLFEKLDDQCSCGAQIKECPIWGKVANRLSENCPESVLDRYDIVQDVFYQQFGSDKVIVDSSKRLSYAKLLHRHPAVNVKMIHLVKDVRAYCISQIDLAIRKDKKLKKRNPYKHMREWYKDNREMYEFFQTENIPVFRLGYEELSLYPEKIVSLLSKNLDIHFDESMLDLTPGNNHIAHGNRMAQQKEKSAKIYYDNRWFYRSEWMLPFLLLPKVSRLNKQLVYSNETNRLWNQ